jgi:PhnB protein
MATQWRPDGYHSITPYLSVDDAARAIDFYREAFGAEELMRLPAGDKIAHAEVRIGNSPVMLADVFPEQGNQSPTGLGGTAVSLMIYVEDADATFARALAAGAESLRPVEDQFYGDRTGTVRDPFGHVWTVATHVEDLSDEEIGRRMQAMMGG